ITPGLREVDVSLPQAGGYMTVRFCSADIVRSCRLALLISLSICLTLPRRDDTTSSLRGRKYPAYLGFGTATPAFADPGGPASLNLTAVRRRDSMSKYDDKPATGPANGRRLFLASFLTLIAAGIGFSIRGAILSQWGSQFGFTQTELGKITGAGLWGF